MIFFCEPGITEDRVGQGVLQDWVIECPGESRHLRQDPGNSTLGNKVMWFGSIAILMDSYELSDSNELFYVTLVCDGEQFKARKFNVNAVRLNWETFYC